MSGYEYDEYDGDPVEDARQDAKESRESYKDELTKKTRHEHYKLPHAEARLKTADDLVENIEYLFGPQLDSGDGWYEGLDALTATSPPDAPETIGEKLYGRSEDYWDNMDERRRLDREKQLETDRKTIADIKNLLQRVQNSAMRQMLHDRSEIVRHPEAAEDLAERAGKMVTKNLDNTIQAAKEDAEAEGVEVKINTPVQDTTAAS